jgi:PST family polysaccharide transporter
MATVGSITVLEQVFTGVFRVLSIVILSRLLPVSAFGLIAMVGFFQLLLQTISGSGLIESIIQVKDLKAHEVAGIFWINCGLGLVLGAVLALSGPAIASFNGEPQLSLISLAMGGLFFLQNVPQTQSALLRRSMRAETQSVIVIVSSCVSLMVTVASALIGWGVWSILAGTLVSLIVRQGFVSYYVRFSPWQRFSFSQVRPMLSYGLKATFGSLVGFLTLNIQTLALGKYASPADVGFYNRAQNLYQQPLKQLVWPLMGVALPAMSALQGDRVKLLNLVNRATWLLSFVLAPFSILIIVSGDLVVGLLLGAEWGVTGEVIRWVAIAQVPLLFNTPLTRANAAIGRPARAAIWNVVFLPFLIAGVIYYAPRGVVEVAQFIMVLRLISYPLFLWANLTGAGMPSVIYIKSVLWLIAFQVIFGALGCYLRAHINLSTVAVEVAFLVLQLAFIIMFQYFMYRVNPIGREVLGWVFSKVGSFVPVPKCLIP